MIALDKNAQEQPGRVKQNILKAVVKILGPKDQIGNTPSGTGFLISKDFQSNGQLIRRIFLATNKHILGDWNVADGNISHYNEMLSVYFYKTAQTLGNYYELIGIDLKNKPKDQVMLHPNPKVDVALICIDEETQKTKDLDLLSFDVSYFVPFEKVISTYTGMGDQIFAIGYPFGITSLKNNYPIAKSCYLSSLPGTEMVVKMKVKNRNNEDKEIDVDGKIFLIDGLIVGGNSGSPIVLPAEIKTRINPETKNIEWTKEETKNVVIGIVSSGWSSAGLTIIYSSDYILELINSVK